MAQPPRDRFSSALLTGQPGGRRLMAWGLSLEPVCDFEGPRAPGRGRGAGCRDLASIGQG